ncbi:MAG: ABC transporter substrate-binding protein [Candidatus Methylomirabilales bacterium]
MRRLGIGLALLLLAAPAGAGTSLKFYYPVHLTGPLVKEVEAIVAEFHKANPDIRVEPVWGGNYAENMQKTVAALQAGSPPDLAVHLAVDLVTLRDMDAAIPLDEFIQRDGGEKVVGDFFPAFLADLKTEGKTWALPFQRSTPILYFNKDLFRKAGLDPAKPPTTWDELLATAQKATLRGAQGQTTTWGLTIPDDIWLLMCFIYQNGGRTSSPDFKKVYLGEAPAIEAVQFWADLANKHKVMPRHRTFPISVQDFAAGNTAMLIHSTGNLRFVRDSAKFEWGTAFLPKHKRQAVAIGGAGIYIFKKAPREKQEAAWKFIKFATSPEMQARWNIGSGYIATRKSAFDLPIMKEYTARLPQALVARDQLPHALPEMSTHENWKMRHVFVTTFQEILDEKYSAADGMKRAQAEIEKILAPYQK